MERRGSVKGQSLEDTRHDWEAEEWSPDVRISGNWKTWWHETQERVLVRGNETGHTALLHQLCAVCGIKVTVAMGNGTTGGVKRQPGK